VPWQLLCARAGCTLAFIPLTTEGTLDLAAAEKQWTDRIRMVALTHVSNVLGTVNDVKSITEMAHARGAVVLVDGAQSVPHFRVDVADIDCDFLAFSGHKMCGPMGIGVLYGKEQLLEQMPPWMGGGEMISAVHREKSTWNELPYKFEAGTPNVEGAIGLGAAIDYLHALEFPAIEAWEAELTRYALKRLQEVPELTIYGAAPHRGAVVSFNLGSIHAHDVAQYVDKEGIAVRAGHHCAQPLMRLLDIPGTARASFSFYNTFSEIDRLHDALLAAAEFYA
jgi:cysteine desulfurase/selenocysteine lyase